MKIAVWNIRGLNDSIKRLEVVRFLSLNKPDLLGLVETHVKQNKEISIMSQFHHYGILSNKTQGRIWLFYNPSTVALSNFVLHEQLLHCDVLFRETNQTIAATFVYGQNAPRDRVGLWEELVALSRTLTQAWIVLGDFNVVIRLSDRVFPNPPSNHDIMEFNSCLAQCYLDDMHSMGSEFTWSNKQDGHSDNEGLVATASHTPSCGSPMAQLFHKLKLERILTAKYAALSKLEVDLLFQRAKDGVMRYGIDAVNTAFVEYYTSLLGVTTEVVPISESLFASGPRISDDVGAQPTLPITRTEIKQALFSIPSNQSPGHDGFSSGFFKHSWATVGDSFCLAVEEYFKTGKMKRRVNVTLLTPIPKKEVPLTVQDFRLIACYSVIYKTISKIIANRLQKVLPILVGNEQAAFIKGCNIFENIMMSHNLIKGYNQGLISPRCLIKVDIKKASNSLQWGFIK
ncbi:uncharacterized protein LOC141601654 [Silene latifolia]|uniref:uncharacterized protein LOC141601654 n=1 Tax=Silene latifolia TaxID=37657 RepID=UPI003D7813A2